MPAATDRILVALEDVAVGYRRPLLTGVNLELRAGQYWGLFGPNGGGKTTLAKTLLAALPPLAGAVRRAPELRVGYVPQLSALNDGLPLTVGQVVLLGSLDRVGGPSVKETLGRVGMDGAAGAPFASLSGGQRQRVLVARALHRVPDLLVLDEPTNGVDLPTRHALMHLFATLNGEGMAVLLVTHHLAEVGHEVGRVLWVDAPQALCLSGLRDVVLGHPALAAAYGGAFATAPGGGVSWQCSEGEVHGV
jgi:ABC-type Mn2+/Zn2+ transport system ATPase subunit